jgi:hypothetical protein
MLKLEKPKSNLKAEIGKQEFFNKRQSKVHIDTY